MNQGPIARQNAMKENFEALHSLLDKTENGSKALDEMGPWLIQQRRQYPKSSDDYELLLKKLLSEPLISKISLLGMTKIYRAAMREIESDNSHSLQLFYRLLNTQPTLPPEEALNEFGPWLIQQKLRYPYSGVYDKFLEKILSEPIISRISPLGFAEMVKAAMTAKEQSQFPEAFDTLLTKLRSLSKQAESKTEAAESKEAEPEQAEPEQAEPEQAEPEQAEPEQAEPEQAEPEQAEPEQAEPEQAESKIAQQAEPEKPLHKHAQRSVFKSIVRKISSPAILAAAVTASFFAFFAAIPTALVTFATTFAIIKAIQAARGWVAKSAYNRLQHEGAFDLDHDFNLFYPSKATREGFNQGVEAQKSWRAYMGSSYLTYFGTFSRFGQSYQAGRHVQTLREEEIDNRNRATQPGRGGNKPT